MKLFLLILVLFCGISSRACDVCGGMSSSSSLGILASTQYHFLGLKTEFKSFSSYMHGILHSKEQLIRSEIIGRIQLHPRFQFLVSIPFQSAWQSDDFGRSQIAGVGDVQSIVNGVIVHRTDSSGQTRDFVSIGSGIKWPTGWNVDYPDPQKNLYPGTGSFDLLVAANALHKFLPKLSAQMEFSYAIKGSDRAGFKYGQAGMLALSSIFMQPFKRTRLLINLGPAVEWNTAASNKSVSLQSTYSKGWQFGFNAGINGIVRNWVWTFGTRIPIWQYLFAGNVKQWPSIQASINYLIEKKSKK